MFFLFFFFNDTATTEIYTLSLHDALPISFGLLGPNLDKSKTINSAIYGKFPSPAAPPPVGVPADVTDRKSTRLNSSHLVISYAVFCLKKKKTINSSVTLAIELNG